MPWFEFPGFCLGQGTKCSPDFKKRHLSETEQSRVKWPTWVFPGKGT